MSTEKPSNSLPPAREPSSSDTAAEKDQYSLDEMMKALRDKERAKEEQGEVVTRSDGSVARKVKRRRRRSDQPETSSSSSSSSSPSSAKEKKSLLFKVIIVACLLFALFLGGFFLLLSHNSKSYRVELEETASEWTGAEVQFIGYKRLPVSVNMKSAKFDWPAASYLRELEVKRIDGDARFSNFLGSRAGGLQIGGTHGTLITQLPTASGEVGLSFEEGDFPFTYDQYYCQALDVAFGESKQIGLKGVSASLRHIPNEGGQLTLDQGTFQLEGWQPFSISTGLVRFDEGVVNLKSLSLDPPESEDSMFTSSLKLSGLIPLTAGAQVQLETSTSQYSLSGLIGKKLSRFFSGAVVESKGNISYTMGDDELDEIVINFTAEQVKVMSFPFLANLSELFPDRQLDDLTFNSGLTGSAITGTLRARPGGIALENLEMSQKGNIRFKGGIIISTSGKIGGKIDLWINRVYVASNALLANSPILNGTEKSGFVKVSFRLGGTVSQPDDTFRSEIGLEAALPGFSNDGNMGDEDLWQELGN